MSTEVPKWAKFLVSLMCHPVYQDEMFLRKMNLWVGRHMSAKRWIVIYVIIFSGGFLLSWPGWQVFLGILGMIIGALGVIGHSRRLLEKKSD